MLIRGSAVLTETGRGLAYALARVAVGHAYGPRQRAVLTEARVAQIARAIVRNRRRRVARAAAAIGDAGHQASVNDGGGAIRIPQCGVR
jgi:hypothetical protein